MTVLSRPRRQIDAPIRGLKYFLKKNYLFIKSLIINVDNQKKNTTVMFKKKDVVLFILNFFFNFFIDYGVELAKKNIRYDFLNNIANFSGS